MGNKALITAKSSLVSLVIFTCEGREHLLQKCFKSFVSHANFQFSKIILAVDGKIDQLVIKEIEPDIIVQSYLRKGYVNSISGTLKVIDTPYFFWLEDDWDFRSALQIATFLSKLQQNLNWAQIIYSKYGPLDNDLKHLPLENNLFETPFGFSANPCLCNTNLVRSAFCDLAVAPKGDTLGEDGFENFLTKTFATNNIKCVIHDPVDHLIVSHEGYLESTPRNWHMTNSLNNKTQKHLLTVPEPSLVRKTWMFFKLAILFLKISFSQFFSNKIYEFCFRIIAAYKMTNKSE